MTTTKRKIPSWAWVVLLYLGGAAFFGIVALLSRGLRHLLGV